MFLLYFLDSFINLVKYLQRVPLDVSINWRYLHQDTGKTYSELSKIRSYWTYSKATIRRLNEKEYCRLSGYERIVTEDHQNCLSGKREVSNDKPSACKKRWEMFCQKSNGKSRYLTIY